MRARHHHGRASPLVRHVANGEDEQAFSHLKMVDQVAADLAGRLQHYLDCYCAPTHDTTKARRGKSKLKRASLVELDLLATQFLSRAIA
jgi:hypothetical protein